MKSMPGAKQSHAVVLTRYSRSEPGGFALVITLSLMVLLTVVAVGMLTLASIQLRTTTRGQPVAIARANAIMAMQMAIGELQKYAGPDQRITATSDILGDPVVPNSIAQPNLTGVWESKKQGPDSTSTDFDTTEKSDRFLKWLVSGTEDTVLESDEFASEAPSGDLVDLISQGAVNAGGTVVKVEKVSVSGKSGSSNGALGHFAYAVLDEGVKSRVNMGSSNKPDDLEGAMRSLGSAERPDIGTVDALTRLESEKVNLDSPEGRGMVSKMVSLQNSELAYQVSRGEISSRIHGLTTSSRGVLADVANGGLKRDFNLLAEAHVNGSLPQDYADKTIYEQAFETDLDGAPSWKRAFSYASLFNSPALTTSTNNAGIPAYQVTAPNGWYAGEANFGTSGKNAQPGKTATLSNIDPPGAVLLPSVLKAQVAFGLVVRDLYEYPSISAMSSASIPRDAKGVNTGNKLIAHPTGNISDQAQDDVNNKSKNASDRLFDSPYDYTVNLIYCPIITLHNPYNVPLKFDKLKVDMVNVPFAFKILVNGESRYKPGFDGFIPLSELKLGDNELTKRIGLILTDELLPGEVKIYSPKIDPDASWAQDSKSQRVFVENGTENLEEGGTNTSGAKIDASVYEGQAGWNEGVGFENYFVRGGNAQKQYAAANHTIWNIPPHKINVPSVMLVKESDTVAIDYTVKADSSWPEKKFSIEMTREYPDPSSPGFNPKKERSAVFSFDYKSDNDLIKAVMNGPGRPTSKFRHWPEDGTSEEMPVSNLWDHSRTPVKDMKGATLFTVFTAAIKTPKGGDGRPEDGDYAAKPFTFNNSAAFAVDQKVVDESQVSNDYELSFIDYVPGNTIAVQADTGRSRALAGNTEISGVPFGTLLEAPLSPLQSLSTLNGALLAAGTSLPRFSLPVGNSYAHPLMSPDIVTGSSAAGPLMTDHSFLLNAALYDSFYFSGLQSQATLGNISNGATVEKRIDDFISLKDGTETDHTPLPDARLKGYFASGESTEDIKELLQGNDGYREAASFQMIEGAFNVNSTSVDAWKSVLASMKADEARALITPGGSSGVSTMTNRQIASNADEKGGRFSRTRLPGSDSERGDRENFWKGPIDLTSTEITELATKLVEEIKKRGPFLSLSEFVNRQIGSAGPLTVKGAIQAAIDETDINEIALDADAGIEVPTSGPGMSAAYPNLMAMEGDSAQGSPGFLMQSDVLAVLGNTATVRSDTFTIRAYGDSVDASGRILATAHCEVVVQRVPDYIDPVDRASVIPANLSSEVNQKFGRRFQIVSLRWLTDDEV